ncbi:MAG TPA: hypothetical protein VFY45_14425 [Baekduia sp.]|nr:hypothetical protein [Baekduia sp.]
MVAAFRTIIRRRDGETEKRRFATLAEAVDELETELRSVASVIARAPRVERALGREYEPAEQVAVRGELRGPGRLRAGVDVRGDGTVVAFTGVVRRRPIELGDREDAWAGLRRELGLATR